MLDRDQEPRLREQAPYEHRFYGLLTDPLAPMPVWPHLASLAALVLTTVAAGFWILGSAADAAWYTAGVLFVLAARHGAHAWFCRAHGLAATRPYFLPFPVLFGSVGSILRLRTPFKTRRDLFDLGFVGPLASFLASLPLLVLGSRAAGAIQAQAGPGGLHEPLAARAVAALLGASLPAGQAWEPHPLLWAGWFGLFVTFLNLLPVAHFDGGRLAAALLGRRRVGKARLLAAVFVLLALLQFEPLWLAWAALVVALPVHEAPPLNPFQELDPRRRLGLVAAGALLVLCALPPPLFVR